MNGSPNPVTRKRIYDLIYQKEKISKQDIAYELKLSLPTVTQNLLSLENAQLINRGGSFASTGGRKAQVISCNYNARIAIGLEIRRHTFSIAAIDLLGTPIRTQQYLVPFTNEEPYFSLVSKELLTFIEQLDYPSFSILGVGIVLQGLISSDGRLVTYGKILDCTGLSIESFTKHLPYPCTMIHDAEAAATMELWNHPERKNAIFFHIRDNLSGALIVNGKFLKGCELKSGVFEHMTVIPDGPPCYCGKRGCMETCCSTTALLLPNETLEDFFRHLRDGIGSYQERWTKYLSYLAIAIDNLHMVIDYDIILGGTIAPYISENDIEILLTRIRNTSAFPTERHYISTAVNAKIPIACGAALPYIKNFLKHLVNEC